MANYSYENPKVTELSQALFNNPNLSELYQVALTKIAVVLDRLLFVDLDLSKLKDYYATLKISDFPIDKIENGDITSVLLTTSLRRIVGNGFGNECLNQGIEKAISKLVYPEGKEIEDETCIFELLAETVGLQTMFDAYSKSNPEILMQAMNGIIPNPEKFNTLLALIDNNYLLKEKAPSNLGLIEKEIIDYFSELSNLGEERIDDFRNKLIAEPSYMDKPDLYESVIGVEEYFNSKMGLNLDGVKTI